MGVLKLLGVLALLLVVALLLLVVLGASKRLYTVLQPENDDDVDRAVDLLVVATDFCFGSLPLSMQGIEVQECMTFIVHNNSEDDGVYTVLNGKAIRIVPLSGGERYFVASGVFRNTTFTVPKPDGYGKSFVVGRGDTLHMDRESFVFMDEDDTGEPFKVQHTSLYHCITAVNRSANTVDLCVHGHVVPINAGHTSRIVCCPDQVHALSVNELHSTFQPKRLEP